MRMLVAIFASVPAAVVGVPGRCERSGTATGELSIRFGRVSGPMHVAQSARMQAEYRA